MINAKAQRPQSDDLRRDHAEKTFFGVLRVFALSFLRSSEGDVVVCQFDRFRDALGVLR